MGLSASKNLGGGKISEILVIRDYIYRKGGAFQVVSPGFESLEDGKKFLVVNVVV